MRRRVWDALCRTEQSHWRRQAFTHCGEHVRVLRSADRPDAYKLAGSYCHDRLCTPCANARSRLIAANVTDHIRNRDVRFITLTIAACSKMLGDRIDSILDSFARLRQTALWRRSVTGGVYFLEIKRSASIDSWHVHIHVLVEGTWIDQKLLSDQWLTATGDSSIVDIRRPKTVKGVATYVTKYASKPLDPEFARDPDLLDEAVLALRGRRLCTTLGSWRGTPLTAPPDTGEWYDCGTFEDFLDRVIDHDQSAIDALTAAGVTDVAFWALQRAPCYQRPPPIERPIATQLLLFDDVGTVYTGCPGRLAASTAVPSLTPNGVSPCI